MNSDHRISIKETRLLGDGPQEFQRRWPGWLRMFIIIGASALAWAGLALAFHHIVL